LLRSLLRPHRGISQDKLPLYLGFFQFVHNVSSCTMLADAAKPCSARLSPAWLRNEFSTTPKPNKSHRRLREVTTNVLALANTLRKGTIDRGHGQDRPGTGASRPARARHSPKLISPPSTLRATRCRALSRRWAFRPFLTAAACAGASVFRMREVSRHKSIQVLADYVCEAKAFEDHAGETFL